MTKLKGFENTYYPDRWEHNGKQVCKLTDRSYLLFDDNHEVIKVFRSLDAAEKWLDENK